MLEEIDFENFNRATREIDDVFSGMSLGYRFWTSSRFSDSNSNCNYRFQGNFRNHDAEPRSHMNLWIILNQLLMMLKTNITGQQFQEAEVEAKIDRVSYNVTAYPAEFRNSDI